MDSLDVTLTIMLGAFVIMVTWLICSAIVRQLSKLDVDWGVLIVDGVISVTVIFFCLTTSFVVGFPLMNMLKDANARAIIEMKDCSAADMRVSALSRYYGPSESCTWPESRAAAKKRMEKGLLNRWFM